MLAGMILYGVPHSNQLPLQAASATFINKPFALSHALEHPLVYVTLVGYLPHNFRFTGQEQLILLHNQLELPITSHPCPELSFYPGRDSVAGMRRKASNRLFNTRACRGSI